MLSVRRLLAREADVRAQKEHPTSQMIRNKQGPISWLAPMFHNASYANGSGDTGLKNAGRLKG